MINAKDSQNTFYILDKKNDVPIVFIHGVGLNHKIWEPQINIFENTFLAYDILGHGKTPLNKENLSFTNTRGAAGSKISIPMMHKPDSGLRPYYLTHEFTIHDAPFNNEIVIAIGGASTGRAHARTGDRYQDMKEMGIEPK